MSKPLRTFYVYILANRSRTLYTGVTNDLEHRVRQHKAGAGSEFTSRYHITRLVYYEAFTDVRQAIEWEKRIKGWTRAKKVALIEERNPHWKDLAEDWFEGEVGHPATTDHCGAAGNGPEGIGAERSDSNAPHPSS
jgi:putative endonuclease